MAWLAEDLAIEFQKGGQARVFVGESGHSELAFEFDIVGEIAVAEEFGETREVILREA